MFSSTIGKKLIMGVTGLGLFAFIVNHVIGNLNQLRGPEAMNAYSAWAQSISVLWPIRAILLLGVALHIWAATALTLDNRRARPVPNARNQYPGASYASRTMIWSGVIVLAFLVYHLLHFTIGATDPLGFQQFDAQGRHDVYKMVVRGFQNPALALSYMVAVGLLCIHLSHGFAAVFRSAGLMSQRWRSLSEKASVALALLIFLGFISVPSSVLLGWIQ